MTDDEYTEWDAAYVLGALSVTERRRFEQHVSGCRSCRQSVSELAPLPALLAAAPAPPERAPASVGEHADAAASDPASLSALADRVRIRRRRGRMLLAAAAVGLIVFGAAAGYGVTQGLGTPAVVAAGESVRLDPVGDSGVHADMSLRGEPWGTRLDWSCSYPPGLTPAHDYDVTGRDYELAVVDAAGIRTVVATWTSDGDPRTTGLSAATSTPLDEISRIELSAASGILLAVAPR